MKYIDAEKLIAKIERLKDKYPSWQLKLAMDDLCNFITSLQQEQPEADGDDGKFVKISVRKEFAEQFQKLGDEIQTGQSSFIGAMNQQEVDLEKEIDRELDTRWKCEYLSTSKFRESARHFAEWGAIHLNARK